MALATLPLDVVRTAYSVKGDEATYVSMALSVAYDGDLAWDRKDLVRFWALYRRGPEGIFLKRGQSLRIRPQQGFPFVRVSRRPELRPQRLYFGKAFAHALAAAPFARVAGLNGLLFLNVALWGACVFSGYVFLRARSPDGPAALMSLAFFGASITPIYLVWATPEIFHVALVFLAYFLWLYRYVAPPATGWFASVLRGNGSLWLAALLLGIAAFSKPPNVGLIMAPVLLLWKERRLWAGAAFGMVAGATLVGLFALNAVVSGDFNYQGGDRKTFYGTFPFERPEVTYDTTGTSRTTNEIGSDEGRGTTVLADHLGLNAWYFVAGRHAGFAAYFFPGVVVLASWLRAWRRSSAWQWVTFAVVAASALGLLALLPYTWAGGGGPPGNRYFLSLYPALLFLMPPVGSWLAGATAWLGGAALIGHILANPFVSAKSPWLNPQGLLLRLPVELTMVNDLPVMLNTRRARVPYGRDPSLFLYFLDEHTDSPEPDGMWVAGNACSEIIVRSSDELRGLTLALRALVTTRVAVSAGGETREAVVEPGPETTVTVPAKGVEARGAHSCVLRVCTTGGAVPALVVPGSRDGRLLGVQMRVSGQTTESRAGA